MAKILVCEDDPVFRQVVEFALDARGHEVACVADVGDAVRSLAAARYDLMITDIVMPEQDGLELIRAVRENGAKLPILVVTGGMPEFGGIVQKAAEALGADEVLLKPVPIPRLMSCVDALLAARPVRA
jgi:CheY-like chemotaxis protein